MISILILNLGVGKTFQIISFVHCLLNNNKTQPYFKSILILTPVNVLTNWYQEIKKWIWDNDLCLPVVKYDECRNYDDKMEKFKRFQELGGIFLIGHQSFCRLILNKDPDEPDDFFKYLGSFLLDPGPDLLVIDEGHIIRNQKVQLHNSLNKVKTKRRIILTGTPLQVNLI